jgi:signal transduction histidine kinase
VADALGREAGMIQTDDPTATRQEIESLRRQLLQAQRLCSLGALASSVAHEFNNILTTIINYSKLAMGKQDEAARTRALEKILKASERAAQITGGMLGFARSRPEERKPTDLVRLVQEVLVLVEKDLSKHRVRLETRFHTAPVQAVISATQIQQIILNLVINARQAMPQGGHMRVEVRSNHETNMAEIVVADTGTGVPPDQLRHIFEPFYTTKTPDDTGKGGTGLGLAICRDIIEAHNGRIRVESVVGRGTTFTVKLPLVSTEAQAVA